MSKSFAVAALAVLCVIAAQPRRASACCANRGDELRVTKVFSIPGTDLLLVAQRSYLDWLGDGIGPEWKSQGAPVPPSIDDRLVFDYVIYDAELRPRAGVLTDVVRDDETHKVVLKNVYAKLGELPKSVEDELVAYQAALNARGPKDRKRIIELATFLGAVALPRSPTCAFQGRVKATLLTVLYTDKLTQNQLPVSELAVAFPCHNPADDSAESTRVEAVRCFDDVAHQQTVVVVGEHCNGDCRGMYTDHLVGLSAQKLVAMRENIIGFRAAKAKDYAGAREHFSKSVQLAPDYSHANFNLACTLARLGQDWSTAKEPLERLLSKNDLRKIYREKINSDGDLEPWRKNAAFVAWVGATAARYDAAATVAKLRVESANQAEAQRLNREGMRLYKQKDLLAAALKFEKAASVDPKSLTALTNAASVYSRLGDRDAAIRQLGAAMKLSKKRTQERIRQDPDYDSMRDTDEVRALLAD